MSQLVSIIIPCYNNEAFVELAIASALQQSYPHVEVIAIDDGSTDRSLEIIRSFGDRIHWETRANQGAPAARNRGLELAQGEWIKFLDADDVLLPNCLELQVAKAQTLQPKQIVYGDAIWVDREGKPLPGFSHQPRQPHQDPIAHILENSPLTSCPLHKREYLQEIGGFDTTLPRGQEHDLHLRLVLAGVKFIYHPDAVYQYREYRDSGRISNHTFSRKNPMVHFETLQKHRRAIEQSTGKPLSLAVQTILAQRFWAMGRAILREGYPNEASQYFQAAQALDAKGCITGKAPYPLFVHLFGPHRAESALETIKRLFKPSAA